RGRRRHRPGGRRNGSGGRRRCEAARRVGRGSGGGRRAGRGLLALGGRGERHRGRHEPGRVGHLLGRRLLGGCRRDQGVGGHGIVVRCRGRLSLGAGPVLPRWGRRRLLPGGRRRRLLIGHGSGIVGPELGGGRRVEVGPLEGRPLGRRLVGRRLVGRGRVDVGSV